MDSSGDQGNDPLFALPGAAAFQALGMRVQRELRGGHQSRVVQVTHTHQGRSRDLVVKLIDADSVDRTHTMARLQVRDRVAYYDDRVVPIVTVAGSKVHRIERCLAVASPKIEGRYPDITARPDVERMGRALARLHQSLRLVSADLPMVSALRAGALVEGLLDNHQLLHGDFAPSNLLVDQDGRLWIFDFEECGYGPVEFELGNTLFMVLFQTSQSLHQPSDEFRQFRRWFLGAYRADAELAISELMVDLAQQARSDALRYWLTHLDEAPVGIRTSSDSWMRHVRSFVGMA